MQLDISVIAAISGAVVLVIGAVATGIVTIITAVKTVGAKADVIVGHVNSEKTASIGRESTLVKENTLLREMLEGQKRSAALLAQALAISNATGKGSQPLSLHDADTTARLEDIAESTAKLEDIAVSTASIDEKTK